MTAISKMTGQKMWLSVYRWAFSCIQHLLDIGSNLVKFSQKIATNMATKFKMAPDEMLAFHISTGF